MDNNNILAVVSQSGETLNYYDLSSGKRTGQLSDLTSEPHELVLDPRTNLLYLTHTYEHGMYGNHGKYSHQLSVIHCGNGRQVIEIIDINPYEGPHGIALDQAHDIIYVSVEGGISNSPNGGGIVGIDLKTRKVVKAIGSGHYSHWFVMTPDGKKAYTCNKEAKFISVIDLENERLVGKIDIAHGCEQPGISKDGRWAFFPTPALSMTGQSPAKPQIEVIDTSTDKIVKSIPMDMKAMVVYVDAKDRLLIGQYQLEFDEEAKKPIPYNGKLLVLAPEDQGFVELGTVDVELMPLTLLASPDGRRTFVANVFSGTVTIVDMDSMKVERTLHVDTVRRQDKSMHQGAHGLALIP